MIHLLIDDNPIDIGCVCFHYQDAPYPGGHGYVLQFSDKDLVNNLSGKFAAGTTCNLTRKLVQYAFATIDGILGLKYFAQKYSPAGVKYWLNTISKLSLDENSLTIEGECSEHQPRKDS
jgi:hypothetical protein